MVHTGIALVQEPWNVIRGLNKDGTVFSAPKGRPKTCVIGRDLKASMVPEHTTGDLTTVKISVTGGNWGFRGC